jgi:hypothetical protein
VNAYGIRADVAAVNITLIKKISIYPSTLRGDQSLHAKGKELYGRTSVNFYESRKYALWK